MVRRLPFVLIAVALLNAAIYVAYDRYLAISEPPVALDDAPECNTCTLRHQAIQRTRLLLSKQKEAKE